MKKKIILIIFTLIVIQAFPESIENLKAQREKLYEKYTNINIPGKISSKANIEKSISILKELVIVDTRIIGELSDFNIKAKEYDLKIASLNEENKSLTGKLNANNDQLFIIYVAGVVIVLLLIFALIFLCIYYIKLNKAKKKTLNYAEMLKQADNDHLALQQANETIKLKDKDLTEKKSLINTLLKEKELLEKNLIKIQNSLNEEIKQQPLTSSERIEQAEKANINMAKIEKLVKMKELGIVTEEEFNTFKQKFLSEL